MSTFVVSNLNDSGADSLRQAIAQADGTPGPNEIDFATGLSGTITLASGQLTIAHNDLTIVGPGAGLLSLSGNNISRVFEVNAVTAMISGLTITGGSASGSDQNGGGLYNNGGTVAITACTINANSAALGGGLYNYNATLAITDTTIADNTAAYGGGLYNNSYNATSTVTISDTTICANSATTSGGGLEDNSGGSASNNGGVLGITDCTIRGNSASLGGGLHSYGGLVTVARSTFRENSVAVDGGGLYAVGKAGSLVTITDSSIRANAATDGAGLSNNAGTMMITDSSIRDNSASGTGDAGGGIDNYTGSTLTILRSTISGNSVGAYGGGIDNIEGATATIVDSTISDNHTGGLGGGIYSYNATLTITNSSLSDNSASYGGGLYNNSYQDTSLATITDSAIHGNSALQGGGGIDNDNGATLTLTGGTLSGNTASGSGGGLHNFAGTVTVAVSTISGNTASGSGGGLANNSGTLTITDSTIAGNAVMSGYGGGVYNNRTLTVGNTIIAGNTAANGPDVSGDLGSQGHNLIGNPSGMTGWLDTDLLSVDPRLGALQDNGGPTQTIALLPGSAALNAGDPAELGLPDQRGVVRKGGVNIGAYQASAVTFMLIAPARVMAGVPFDLTVTALDPFGQLAVGYTATVSFRTTDPDPRVILPVDYTFTSADAGVHTFLGDATLLTRGDQTISLTDTADDSIAGSTTVQVKHRHHHGEIG
jgi:hypothetical protein